MSLLNRTVVLNTLIKHETMTLEDLVKGKNFSTVPDEHHLKLLLKELEEDGYIEQIGAIESCTLTITSKGIAEGNRTSAL